MIREVEVRNPFSVCALIDTPWYVRIICLHKSSVHTQYNTCTCTCILCMISEMLGMSGWTEVCNSNEHIEVGGVEIELA